MAKIGRELWYSTQKFIFRMDTWWKSCLKLPPRKNVINWRNTIKQSIGRFVWHGITAEKGRNTLSGMTKEILSKKRHSIECLFFLDNNEISCLM